MRIWAPIAGALCGFAANSLLTRAAVGRHLIDAVSFTEVRLLSGAIALLVIDRLLSRSPRSVARTSADVALGAIALSGYAFAFAFAYTRIDAGIGALVMFGSVQVLMLLWSVASGERPSAMEWLGLAVALVGLVVLTRPGQTAPNLPGVLLMALAGVGWGTYSVRGRGAGDPVSRTTTSFLWAATIGIAVVALSRDHLQGTRDGLLLAALSGTLASGAGYVLWYRALPALTSFRASLLQLTVPVLTAAAAVPLLGESLTPRLISATLLILGGVALAVVGRQGA